jgi:hypothetical protein
MFQYEPYAKYVAYCVRVSNFSKRNFEKIICDYVKSKQESFSIGELTEIVQWIVKDSKIYNEYPHDFVFYAVCAFCKPYLKQLDLMLLPNYVINIE